MFLKMTDHAVEQYPAFGGRGACAARKRPNAHRGIEATDSPVLSGVVSSSSPEMKKKSND
jgi:hypothetical protein